MTAKEGGDRPSQELQDSTGNLRRISDEGEVRELAGVDLVRAGEGFATRVDERS